MKLLYATNNNSKIYNMKKRLDNLPIEIVSPKDLNVKLNNAENAVKKTKAYYEETGIPTIAVDSGLYIENIEEEKLPGLFVRRINGKELTDNEMIEYYSELVNLIDGKTMEFYITGLALVTKNGIKTIEVEEDKFILTSKISTKNHRGNSSVVMSIDPTIKKYYTEMSDDDFKSLGQKFDVECLQFINEKFLMK